MSASALAQTATVPTTPPRVVPPTVAANSDDRAAPAATASDACPQPDGEALSSCLRARYSDVDRQLAIAYRAALSATDASGLGKNLVMDWKRALQETQRKWIAFREADCGAPVSYLTSKRPHTREAEQLRCKIAHSDYRLSRLKRDLP